MIIVTYHRSMLPIPLFLKDIEAAVLAREDLAWDKEGHVRVIPFVALANALRVYYDNRAWATATNSPLPAGSDLFDWTDTV